MHPAVTPGGTDEPNGTGGPDRPDGLDGRRDAAGDLARMAAWEWDIENDRLICTAGLYELHGLPAGGPETAPLGSAAFGQTIHPDDAPDLDALMTACATTGQPVSVRYRVLRPVDGQERVLESLGEVLTAPPGAPRRVVGTTTDITDEVNRRRDAAARAGMLRSILANSQSLIYVKDLEGRYILVNEPLLEARGVTEKQLIGCDDTFFDPDLAPVWQANDRRARDGEFMVEEWFNGPDGRIWYDTVKFPLRDGAGTLYATGGISLDVTARRRSAEAMEEARDAALAANAAKSAFLATMSHEIRTPMTAVIGMTDLLLETDLDMRQQEYLETIRTSGDALLAIINDILDFSRLEAGEMELEERPFDLRRCVEDSLSLVAGAAMHIDLVSSVDPGVPQFVVGDVNRLRQVLVNLAGNAVKFTERGDVLLAVDQTESRADAPGAGDVVLRFSVQDTGIGIPEERMDRLFKSFSQVDASTTRVYGGSGLGLAISQAIVKSMGGVIRVTSTVDVGSTFAFTITLRRRESGEDGGAELVDPAVDLSGRRVLVVDDNDTNRRILRVQLESWGVSCTAVASPRGALAVLGEGPGFDAAILDMHMPGTDGVQLAEQIRRMPAVEQLPLVLLTSLNTKPRDASPDLFAGFHTKPIRAGALRTMLGRILTPRQPGLPTANAAGNPQDGPESLRVLLAEDNTVNQMVAQRLLHNLGHYVDIVGNGQEALDAVTLRDYDVVLMDIHMPVMDGLDASREIRARVPDARQPKIVAMTASSLPEDRRACTEAGMNGFLLKPVRTADLVEALQAATGAAPVPQPRVGGAPIGTGPDSGAFEQKAVNLAVLTQLTADMGATSAAGRHELIEAYLDQADVWVAELGAAARAYDAPRVRMITHNLGSSSALLGAETLADLLAAAGEAARSGNDLMSPVAAVEYEYRLVSMVLRANYGALTTGPGGTR